MRVERYADTQRAAWDDFVRRSKNGTFLFLRDYMEYHRDRFDDYSLILLHDDQIVALLPANRKAESILSHGGLTYGGFITDQTMKLPKMLEVFDASCEHLQAEGFMTLIYKTVPFLYHRIPAEEDRYALFLGGARLIRRGVLTATDMRLRPPFQERRRRGAKKATQNGLVVRQSEDWPGYWDVLTQLLRATYHCAPVHTLEEIEMLRKRFPANIKLFAAFEGNTIVGGVVIHETGRVARAQYIATSERGQALGALDLVFTELLTREYSEKPYFDFGTSDEEDGRRVNKGLIDQKEGYGARVVAHDHYEMRIDAWKPGQFVQALQ
jgi:hypothetical protein